jgi:hypothetical protein
MEADISLFEFLSVAIAIVVSFGVVRLLDGVNYAAKPGQLYWPHLVWLALKLIQHFNIWWSLWERHEASWSYAAFLVQLVPPLVLYLQATALVTPSPQSITNWREHYYSVRRQFFGLNLVFGLSNPLAVLASGIEFRALAAPLIIVALSMIGLLTSSHRVHSALALVALVGNILLIALFTLNPAASPFG